MLKLFYTVLHTILNSLLPLSKKTMRVERLPDDLLSLIATQNMVHTTLTSAFAPLTFSHPLVRNTIHAFKYEKNLHALQLLVNALAPALIEYIGEKRLFGDLNSVLLVPVPTHHIRRRERGFDHTLLLAKTLLHTLNDPSINLSIALTRTHHTPSQTKHTLEERTKNVRGAFSLFRPVKGNAILLLDDVVTTGATFHEARKVLLRGGAHSVLCVACAH